MLNRKKNLAEALTQVENTMKKHEVDLHMPFEVNDEKRKRCRRNAQEIARQFKCPVKGCGKSYGMEGTLTQHIKIKHRDFYSNIIEKCNVSSQHKQKASSSS